MLCLYEIRLSVEPFILVRTVIFQSSKKQKSKLDIVQELEAMADPTRKEVAAIRKKIDAINREMKPLRQSCLKKVKEFGLTTKINLNLTILRV